MSGVPHDRPRRPRARQNALLALVAVLVLAAASAAVSAPAARGAAACSFDPTESVSAAPDEAFNGLFHEYGDSNRSLDDWTGADTTNSVLLPDR